VLFRTAASPASRRPARRQPLRHDPGAIRRHARRNKNESPLLERAQRLGADWRTVGSARRRCAPGNVVGGRSAQPRRRRHARADGSYASGVRLHGSLRGPGGVEQHLACTESDPIRTRDNRWPLGYYRPSTRPHRELGDGERGRPHGGAAGAADAQRRDGRERDAHAASPRRSVTSRRSPSTTSPGLDGGLVKATRSSGGRVIAVGTTVVRALETAAVRASRAGRDS